MSKAKIYSIFSQHGDIDRMHFTLEPAINRQRRKKDGGTSRKSYTEGWIEFIDKKQAKRVAVMFNNQTTGGKKRRNFYREDLWNIKYLPKFKWDNLQYKIEMDRQLVKNELQNEVSLARQANKFYNKQIHKARKYGKEKSKHDFIQKKAIGDDQQVQFYKNLNQLCFPYTKSLHAAFEIIMEEIELDGSSHFDQQFWENANEQDCLVQSHVDDIEPQLPVFEEQVQKPVLKQENTMSNFNPKIQQKLLKYQEQNSQLRNELKQLNNRFNQVLKQQEKSRTNQKQPNHNINNEQLKTALKSLEYWKIERQKVQNQIGAQGGSRNIKEIIEQKQQRIKDLEKQIKQGNLQQSKYSKNLENLSKEEPQKERQVKTQMNELNNIKSKMLTLESKRERDNQIYEVQYDKEIELTEELERLEKFVQDKQIVPLQVNPEISLKDYQTLKRRFNVSQKSYESTINQLKMQVQTAQIELNNSRNKESKLLSELRQKQSEAEQLTKQLNQVQQMLDNPACSLRSDAFIPTNRSSSTTPRRQLSRNNSVSGNQRSTSRESNRSIKSIASSSAIKSEKRHQEPIWLDEAPKQFSKPVLDWKMPKETVQEKFESPEISFPIKANQQDPIQENLFNINTLQQENELQQTINSAPKTQEIQRPISRENQENLQMNTPQQTEEVYRPKILNELDDLDEETLL